MAEIKTGSTVNGSTILYAGGGNIVAADIASNAITTAKLNADAVTGAKIANDSIDSEHFVDGSIDTAHIANNQITSAKCATNINGYGVRTVSTSGPSGGSDGDVWYKY